MPSRSRTRTMFTQAPGTYTGPSGSVVMGYTGPACYEACTDVTMAPPYVVDHSLTLRKRLSWRYRINGSTRYATPQYDIFFKDWTLTYDGYNPAALNDHSYVPAETGVLNTNLMLTKALANMDPNKPVVDLPLFLFELKDFPRMLRNLGDWLRRDKPANLVPDSWLSYSFGWAPLVSDLLNLFDFTEETAKRVRYLRNLENRQRIRRSLGRITVRDDPQAYVYNHGPLHSSMGEPYAVQIRADVREVQKWWYTANASLRSPLPDSLAETKSLARRQVLGLTSRPWDLWDAIPWSWLIDYTANVGTYLEAWGALVALRVTRLNLMCTTTVEYRNPREMLIPGVSVTRAADSSVMTVKRRFPYTDPTPKLSYEPFLNGKQVANLGALVLSRFLGGRGWGS